MGNSRVKRRFELTLDRKQVFVLTTALAVLVGATFVLGMNVGRRTIAAGGAVTVEGATALDGPAAGAPTTLAAAKDPLAGLDQPLPVRDEPAVELKAHQALTDARPIDKAFPVPQAKAAPAPAPAPKPAAAPPSKLAATSQGRAAPSGSSPPAAAPATPAPRPARAAREPARRTGAYAIQVASLPRRSDAERIAKKHGSRNPRIVEAEVPGKGHYYRVLVGAFETQDAAKRQLASLTRSGVQGFVTAIR